MGERERGDYFKVKGDTRLRGQPLLGTRFRSKFGSAKVAGFVTDH